MHRRRPFSVLMTAIAAIWLFAGCSLTYTMNTPTLSHIGYTELRG